MKIKINNYNWSVHFEEPDAEIMNDDGYYIGLTLFHKLSIHIRKGLPEELTRSTVIHELVHAFLFTYGIKEDEYDEEKVCEFFGTHADQIMKLTDKIMTMGGYTE